MTEVIVNPSGAELRIQDGGAHRSSIMLENSIEDDLGSISIATKMSCNFKIDTWYLVILNGHSEV